MRIRVNEQTNTKTKDVHNINIWNMCVLAIKTVIMCKVKCWRSPKRKSYLHMTSECLTFSVRNIYISEKLVRLTHEHRV